MGAFGVSGVGLRVPVAGSYQLTPHLHVAVFPEAFEAFAARQDSIAAARARLLRAAAERREIAAEVAALPGAEGVGLQFVLPVLLALTLIGAGAATVRWAA